MGLLSLAAELPWAVTDGTKIRACEMPEALLPPGELRVPSNQDTVLAFVARIS